MSQRLTTRDGHAPALDEINELLTAYQRVFGSLAPHTPVVTIDTTTPGPPTPG
ncbi:hypothetical protein [Streptomyces syringium]|uniref:Uncharacterized protein n=1 Tax=Streptomyces syringium TaxID=76729 RepID=A0ABS4XWG2_9ACTN|nr:hypothetical protein [Streptomyces syringium]MBP2400725.1 hypothetical protein [Streptomyces syringium]